MLNENVVFKVVKIKIIKYKNLPILFRNKNEDEGARQFIESRLIAARA